MSKKNKKKLREKKLKETKNKIKEKDNSITAKKEKITPGEWALSIVSGILGALIEEPIIMLPIFLLGLVCMPFMLLHESIVKRKLLTEYGYIDCSLVARGNPDNAVDYLWNIACVLKYKTNLVKKHKSEYSYNNGYIEVNKLLDELRKIEKDEQTVDFVKYHIDRILRVESKDTLEDMMNSLERKEFRQAYQVLEDGVSCRKA